MKRKRSITLIEIMIVIVLIGIVASVVGYNVRGGLKKGKEFKTVRGKERLESLLNLIAAESDETPNQIIASQGHILDILVKSGPFKDHKEAQHLMKDGDGNNYEYTVEKGYIVVTAKTSLHAD